MKLIHDVQRATRQKRQALHVALIPKFVKAAVLVEATHGRIDALAVKRSMCLSRFQYLTRIVRSVFKSAVALVYPSRLFPRDFHKSLEQRRVWLRAIVNGRLLTSEHFHFSRWLGQAEHWQPTRTYPPERKRLMQMIDEDHEQELAGVLAHGEPIGVKLNRRTANDLNRASQYAYLNIVDGVNVAEPIELNAREIKSLFLRAEGGFVKLTGCKIAHLEVMTGKHIRLIVDHCQIGRIDLGQRCCRDLEIYNSAIREFCYNEHTGEHSPVRDFVAISNVWIARSFEEGAGGTHHIRKVWATLADENQTLAAGTFHSVKLALDRPTESWLNKKVSWFYEFFADYGNSIHRPVIALMLAFVLLVLFTWSIDPLEPADPKALVGWQHSLKGDSLTKALVYWAQSIFNPLSVFGKPLLVASERWFATAGVVVAFLGAVFLGLIFIALRRRFKLE